tara:strand:+ start:26 stop:490 length:465 start_codon:yes stop_codon:yes gene_type:complete
MIKVDRDTEFKLVRNSFKVIKKINLQEIGFNQISGTNLYKYQSDEYRILNYSIKPKVIFLINIKEDNIFIKLQDISIKNLPNIFKTLNLNIEVKILAKSNFYIIIRHISLRYEDNNKLIKYLSENFKNKFLNNLIDIISRRFDRKLVKKVLKEI